MFDLTGKTALITGSGQGVGAGIARALAEQGASIVINDYFPDRAEAMVVELQNNGGKAVACPFDVTDIDAVKAGVEKAEAELAPIDILINNAGVLRDKSFSKMTLDDFKLVIDVHLMGSVNCTKAVWEIMKQQNTEISDHPLS